MAKSVPMSLGGMGFLEGHHDKQSGSSSSCLLSGSEKVLSGLHSLVFYKEDRVWKHLAKSVPVSLGGMGFSEGHHAKQSGRSSSSPLSGSKKVLSGLHSLVF